MAGRFLLFRRRSTKFAHSLLALVLQAVSRVADLPETLLWLVLRIPATHWYKGDTAVPALYVSAAMRGCVTALARANHPCRCCLVSGLAALTKSE
jgi:hypothetical protein